MQNGGGKGRGGENSSTPRQCDDEGRGKGGSGGAGVGEKEDARGRKAFPGGYRRNLHRTIGVSTPVACAITVIRNASPSTPMCKTQPSGESAFREIGSRRAAAAAEPD